MKALTHTVYGDRLSNFLYLLGFLTYDEQREYFEYLETMSDFVPSPSFKSGISRYQKWYQREHEYFCPRWKERHERWKSFTRDEKLDALTSRVQDFLNKLTDIDIPRINSCLVNKYPNGKYFIAPHQDSRESFGEYPTIILLSLGQQRTISFQKIGDSKDSGLSFDLESGSLFIMAGSTNKYYTHTIQKSDCQGVRYSLTFREFLY